MGGSRRIAYASLEGGRSDVHVRRADGSGARAPVSRDGGAHPLWVRGRNEIVFQHGQDRGIVPVPYRVERGAFAVGAPRPWPGARVAPFEPGYTIRNFDLSPDGERLLVLGPAEPAPRG